MLKIRKENVSSLCESQPEYFIQTIFFEQNYNFLCISYFQQLYFVPLLNVSLNMRYFNQQQSKLLFIMIILCCHCLSISCKNASSFYRITLPYQTFQGGLVFLNHYFKNANKKEKTEMIKGKNKLVESVFGLNVLVLKTNDENKIV